MNKLQQLINELCPNGVRSIPIWEITIWDKKFNAVDNYKQTKVIKYHYYLAAELKLFERDDGNVKILTTNNTNIWADESEVINTFYEGEIVCLPWGGNPIIQYYNGKFITGDNRIATSSDLLSLNNKYLYYFFQNNINEISSFYRGSGIKHPNMASILDMKIPLPPLPIQEEIVRILDKFTELTAELTARKKQYEEYKENLLTLSTKIECKTLKDCIVKINNIKWVDNKEKHLKYIDLSSVSRDDNKIIQTQTINYKTAPSRAQQIVLKNDVIFGTTRPTLRRYSIILDEYDNQICSTGFCVLRADKNLVLPKWIFYNISSSNFYSYIEKLQKGVSYPAISDKEIKLYCRTAI